MIDLVVSEAVRRFLLSKQSEYLSANSINFYQCQLRHFSNWCGDHGWFTTDLDHDRLAEYFARRSRFRKPSTLQAEFRAIHAFLIWCIERNYCKTDLLDGLKWPKLPKVVIEPLTQQDVRQLLRAASQTDTPERDRAILLLMADCGLRSSELINLRDADLRQGYIHVRGKGGKDRRVPVSEETVAVLRAWQYKRGAASHLFVTRLHRPFTRQGLYKLFDRLGERAGISGVRCSPHTLRHTTAQEWLNAGGDLATLQILLGHARLETTMRYLVVGYQQVAKKHRELSLGKQLVQKPR